MEYEKNLYRISAENQAEINLNRTLNLRLIYASSTVDLRSILKNDTFYQPYKSRNALHPAFSIFFDIDWDLRVGGDTIVVFC
ncbi:MAG: hypothetical protein A2X11_12600 [Bacteroidetes bacterium GWE2_42_24]|nr:MAG: hypothetical protein A2X11_12600 [Bacteroidetes bacterium GWE2_42_24]OFY30616.1 MAG: hypothetical protein A2X09_03850 [Bacteroidetes bacterium GWF2_43_11]